MYYRDAVSCAHIFTFSRIAGCIYQPESWVCDTSADRHVVGDKRYFVKFRNLTYTECRKETVNRYNSTTAPIGVVTIDLLLAMEGGQVEIRLEDAYYSPERPKLLSQ